MAKKLVKCKYCQQVFDRNAEPAVDVGGRRYAHKACYEQYQAQIPLQEKEYQALELYIKKLFNLDTLSAKIRKQIKDYREDYNYTYSGMLKTLYWWYEIKGNTTELANEGIGIVPFVYDDACKYYYSIYLAKLANDARETYQPVVTTIEIGSPRVTIQTKRLFDIEEEGKYE